MPTCDCLVRTGLDLEVAVLLAEASQAAYGTTAAHAAWAATAGFAAVESFDMANVQGFWCSTGELSLLVFRGTSNPGQWIRDARFIPVPHPWGFAHCGFVDGIRDLELALQKFDRAATASKRVWITGHSLGGALALMAAARAKRGGVSPWIYTFGQPRVGLSRFADRFGIELPGRLYRFVNQSDIVTRLPPGLLYRHVGIVKRIVRPGVLEAVAESVAPQFSSSRLGWEFQQGWGVASLESATAVVESGIDQPVLIDAELGALSEQQFTELQVALGAGRASDLESLQLEGALPWFADHAIEDYVMLLKSIRDNRS